MLTGVISITFFFDVKIFFFLNGKNPYCVRITFIRASPNVSVSISLCEPLFQKMCK